MDPFVLGIAIFFAVAVTIGWLHDKELLWWNPRRKWSPEIKKLNAAKTAVTEMVEWKKERRIEERQAWATEFEKLDPPVDIDGQEIKPLTKANVEQRYQQLIEQRLDAARARVKDNDPGYRIFNGNGDVVVDTTITGMPITFQPTPPRITPADQVPRPAPPRGGSGVSKPNDDAVMREIAKLKKRIKDLEKWS